MLNKFRYFLETVEEHGFTVGIFLVLCTAIIWLSFSIIRYTDLDIKLKLKAAQTETEQTVTAETEQTVTAETEQTVTAETEQTVTADTAKTSNCKCSM